jgi:ABC-type phosphate transport system ATPase subunit
MAHVDRNLHRQADQRRPGPEALLMDEMVTKTDLVATAKNLEAKLQELKADLIKWMIGQTFAVAALVFAIARLVKISC